MELDCPPPQLRGCACSNLVGLLGTLMAFCFYCYSLNNFSDTNQCEIIHRTGHYDCPKEWLAVSVLLSNLYFCSLLDQKEEKRPKPIVGRTGMYVLAAAHPTH